MAAIHAPDAVEAFLGTGETRLIAAAYRDPSRAGDLYLLEDGTARAVRGWAKQHLRCFFPGCPAPDLTTVARPERRDGFRHGPHAGGHSPESTNHLQGKAVVAQWLRRQLGPDAVEVEAATDSQRTRIADVMARLPDGHRIAFEVQYASLSVDAWTIRHESYRSQGIIDVWLWGHTRVPRPRYRTTRRLDDLQEAVRRTGAPVLWINPETAQLAIATSRHPDALDEVQAFERDIGLAVAALADFTPAAPDGIQGPPLTRLLEAEIARRRRLEEEAQTLERQRRDRARRAIEGAARADTAPPVESIEPAAAVWSASAGVCRSCGGKLDPVLYRRGYHIGQCTPDWTTSPTKRAPKRSAPAGAPPHLRVDSDLTL